MIRAFLIPGLVIGGALMPMQTVQLIDGMDWLRTVIEGSAYLGIAVGLLGVLIFSRHLNGDYRAMQAAKRLLTERGIDASKMRSDKVWTGLFTPQDAEQKEAPVSASATH